MSRLFRAAAVVVLLVETTIAAQSPRSSGRAPATGVPAAKAPSDKAAAARPGSTKAVASDAAAFEAIERQLIDAAHQNPSSFDAHHALGELYIQHGRIAAAIPHLERAQAINGSHYTNSYDLAAAYLEIGRLDSARAQVRILARIKDAGEVHNLLGDIEARANDFTAAAAEYQRAAHMEPTEEHLFDWGNNLLQLRAYPDAIDVFRASLKRHPESARLHVGLGIALYSRGQYPEAVTALCRAADLAPDDQRPYQFLGEMYGVSPEQATEITTRLARFVAAQPKNALANYYYGMNLWKGQAAAADVARVESLLRKSVALDPKLTNGYLQLGILLSEQKRYAEAIKELRSAVRLDPKLAQTHFRLSQAYQRTGQEALAATELELFQRYKAPD